MNVFDLGVLGILGMSALLSFFRGFVREILSLGAWVGASIITLYCFEDVTAWIAPHVENEKAAAAVAALGTFMVALVGISIINSILMKFLKTGAEIGLLDNGMGLLFGVARGILVVGVAYFIMTIVLPEEKDRPVWVREAKTKPYVEDAAILISRVAPEYIDSPLKDAETSENMPVLDSIMGDGVPDEEPESSNNWQSMEELQDRMRDN